RSRRTVMGKHLRCRRVPVISCPPFAPVGRRVRISSLSTLTCQVPQGHHTEIPGVAGVCQSRPGSFGANAGSQAETAMPLRALAKQGPSIRWAGVYVYVNPL